MTANDTIPNHDDLLFTNNDHSDPPSVFRNSSYNMHTMTQLNPKSIYYSYHPHCPNTHP